MAEPVLKKGSNDPAVRDLQEALKALGHDPGPVDGIFGAKTESAVKKFQQAQEIAADGVVGRVTWINIDEDLPPRPKNIPTNPDKMYGEEFRGKGGCGCVTSVGSSISGSDFLSFKHGGKWGGPCFFGRIWG